MPPGYIDTSLPVREPSGMNSQEFDTDDQDFRTGPTKPGCRDDAVSGVLVRQDLIGLVSLDSGFRLVLRSTASRGLPAEPPTSGGEVAARVQGVGQPVHSGKVHRGGMPRAQISRMAIVESVSASTVRRWLTADALKP